VIIDKYVIYDEIGKGSYGKVYRGMDDETKKQVAVKVIDLRQIARMPEGKEKRTRMRLAQTEPELMQSCDSNYVLKCFSIYKNEDLKVLILEFCNGKTLHQELQEKHHLPENEAIIIIRHIINGLMVVPDRPRKCTSTRSSTATSRPRTS
jgi:serine/threonine protein kinase